MLNLGLMKIRLGSAPNGINGVETLKQVQGDEWDLHRLFIWPERAPSRQSGIGAVKRHNINDNSLPGSPNVPVPS